MCQSLVNVSGVETFHPCWSRAEATAEPRADRFATDMGPSEGAPRHCSPTLALDDRGSALLLRMLVLVLLEDPSVALVNAFRIVAFFSDA